ncbi:hypothetical protein GCM10028791_00860 [Echinicola sediminis]
MIMTISCQKEKLNFIEFPMENLPIKISINDTTNLSIELYENGYIKSITTKNKEGIKNGPHIEYFPNGIMKERYTWVKNEISGKYEIFNDLGDKLVRYTYVDGKKMEICLNSLTIH